MTNITTTEKIAKVQENLYLLSEARKQLAELKMLFEAQNAPLIELINDLEAEIKTEVLENGASVSGRNMTAVFTSGRMSWDSKRLTELAETCPEINSARKFGNPTVSFRSR